MKSWNFPSVCKNRFIDRHWLLPNKGRFWIGSIRQKLSAWSICSPNAVCAVRITPKLFIDSCGLVRKPASEADHDSNMIKHSRTTKTVRQMLDVEQSKSGRCRNWIIGRAFPIWDFNRKTCIQCFLQRFVLTKKHQLCNIIFIGHEVSEFFIIWFL